jgi:pimeloyl-ACP methyl ester carboxylesterase
MTTEPIAAPDWFTRAVAAPRKSRFVEVEGCPIHYLQWGDPENPGVVFVPASGAHAYWFAHVAPLLADQLHVIAIDPAGCGDSGRRSAYGQTTIIAEIIGAAADSGMLSAAVPPVLVGHSAGAQHAVRAAQQHGEQLLGVIGIDGLRYARLEKDHALAHLEGPRKTPPPPRVYGNFEEAVSRFRLLPVPLASIDAPWIFDYIARHSYRQVEGGWAVKFDAAQASSITLAFELKDALKDLRCRAASLYAEHTHVADEQAGNTMTALNDGRITAFTIPGTTHYPLIDSPFAFVAALKGIILTWIAETRRSGG